MSWRVIHAECRAAMAAMDAASVDAIVTDPPYPEIDRPYGRLTEAEWHELMREVVAQARLVLKPHGSAVFILQPNSERVGRMRPWLWDFMAWAAREWNVVQDAYWWNFAAQPTVHTSRERGLMRPSVKPCAWLGEPDCYRDQSKVLWTQSAANAAVDRSDRALRYHPSGHHVRPGRVAAASDERGGVTPFNLIPLANTDSANSGGASGHGAATPHELCRWWVRYITKPGGVVLDPFCGSGSVLRAAAREGFDSIGIDSDPASCAMARRRVIDDAPLLATTTEARP